MTKSASALSNRKAQWQELMSLFDEISALPKSERTNELESRHLDANTRNKVRRMLDTLDQTMSILDQPITDRISLEENWYADQWVGCEINGFKLDQLLHEGSIAGVFLALQEEPVKRKVVIKLIRPEAPSQFLDYFRVEQQTLAKLSHPNIAAIHTVEKSEEGLAYIVMEHIDGRVLSTFCDEEELSIRDRLELFLQICDAMSYSHQRGILHRDLKPSNILVREFEGKPTPTIIDFGISSDLSEQIQWPEESLMGTPEYMSPEHILHLNDMDVRADVYSLGMVLFSLLAGRIPFDRTAIVKLDKAKRLSLIAEFETAVPSVHIESLSLDEMQALAQRRNVSPQNFLRQIDTELDYIYLKATNKDRSQRYQSVSGLASDIRAFLDRGIVSAHPSSLWYRARKFLYRNSIASLSVFAIAVLSVIFMIKVVNQNTIIVEETTKALEGKEDAEQVASIILETLEFAFPSEESDRDKATVIKLVDQSFERFKETRGISANVRAKILMKFSRAYRGNDEVARATEVEQLLGTELETYAAPVQAEVLLALSRSARNSGDFQRELEYAIEAQEVSLASSLSGQIPIDIKLAIARAHGALSQPEKQTIVLAEALALSNERPASDLRIKGDILLSLADLSNRQENYLAAEKYYSQGIKILKEHYGDNTNQVVRAQLSELQFLLSSDNPRGNSRHIRQLQKKILNIWGENSVAEEIVLYHLATTLGKEGESTEAARTYESNLKHLESRNKKYDALYIANLGLLSSTYLELSKYTEALESSAAAYDLVTLPNEQGKVFTPYLIAAIGAEHAKVLAANNRLKSAGERVNSSLEFFEKTGGSDLANNLVFRSFLNALQGNHETVKSDIEVALGVLTKAENFNGGDSTFLLAKSMQLYSDLISEWDNDAFDELQTHWQQYVDTNGDKPVHRPFTVIDTFIQAKR